MWNLKTLAQFQGSEIFTGLFQGFMYWHIRLSTLAVKHSLVIMNSGSQSVFDSCFIKFVFRVSGGIKFEILVEDSDTGSPISLTVRIEYLLAF